MMSAEADTHSVVVLAWLALTRPYPVPEAPILGLFYPKQENGLCPASLSLTILFSALFKS